MLIGLADPRPVGKVTETQDVVVFHLQLMELEGHPRNPRLLLRPFHRRRQCGDHGSSEGGVREALQHVRIGGNERHRLDDRSFAIDVGPGHSFSHGNTETHDDGLTRINGHIID